VWRSHNTEVHILHLLCANLAAFLGGLLTDEINELAKGLSVFAGLQIHQEYPGL